jgi:hypothetical protein
MFPSLPRLNGNRSPGSSELRVDLARPLSSVEIIRRRRRGPEGGAASRRPAGRPPLSSRQPLHRSRGARGGTPPEFPAANCWSVPVSPSLASPASRHGGLKLHSGWTTCSSQGSSREAGVRGPPNSELISLVHSLPWRSSEGGGGAPEGGSGVARDAGNRRWAIQ